MYFNRNVSIFKYVLICFDYFVNILLDALKQQKLTVGFGQQKTKRGFIKVPAI